MTPESAMFRAMRNPTRNAIPTASPATLGSERAILIAAALLSRAVVAPDAPGGVVAVAGAPGLPWGAEPGVLCAGADAGSARKRAETASAAPDGREPMGLRLSARPLRNPRSGRAFAPRAEQRSGLAARPGRGTEPGPS